MPSCEFDEFRLVESTTAPEAPEFVARERRVVNLPDTNANNYSAGQITFDGGLITSALEFADMKNAVLNIPLRIKVTASASANFIEKPEMAAYQYITALKNGYHQLIDSVSVEVGNQQIVSRQQFSNILNSYKIMSTWTDEDAKTKGPSIGFAMDTNPAVSYADNGANAVSAGQWEVNTTTYRPDSVPSVGYLNGPSGGAAAAAVLPNTGLRARAGSLLNLNPRLAANPNIITDVAGFPTAGDVFAPKLRMGSTHTTLATTTATTNVYVMATIPLNILHDVFEKLPLLRGAYWRLTFFTHSPCTSTYKYLPSTNAFTDIKLECSTRFCPFMVNTVGPEVATTLMTNTDTEQVSITASLDIGWATTNSNTNFGLPLSAEQGKYPALPCSLDIPMYNLSPEAGAKYIEAPLKTVIYHDHLRVQPSSWQNGVPYGTQTEVTISAGQMKPRYLLIFPYQLKPGNCTTASCDALGVPWAGLGATAAMGGFMSDFNVTVAGAQLYNQNVDYRYQHYQQEQQGFLANNGNGLKGMCQGLVSERMWNENYGYVVVNLERHLEAVDLMPQAITLRFTNRSTSTMCYLGFLVYEKRIGIDCVNGSVHVDDNLPRVPVQTYQNYNAPSRAHRFGA